MSSHSHETTTTYDRVARQFLEPNRERRLDYEWLGRFAKALPRGSRILALGSGPGRDSAEFRALGVSSICLDLSSGMLRVGATEYPGPRVQGDYRAIPIRDSALAGVWANASLLHVAEDDFRVAMREIARVLVSGGRLFLSLKMGKGAEWESKRYGLPRWFQYWTPTDLDREIEDLGFVIEDAIEHQTTADTWLARHCVAAA